jgi:hypothetical protein
MKNVDEAKKTIVDEYGILEISTKEDPSAYRAKYNAKHIDRR